MQAQREVLGFDMQVEKVADIVEATGVENSRPARVGLSREPQAAL